MKKIIICSLLFLLLITGCKTDQSNIPATPKEGTGQTPSAPVKKLTLIYIAGGSKLYMIERWQTIGDYLSKNTGLSIEVDGRNNYTSVIKSFEKNDAQIGYLSGLLYVKLKKEMNVIPLVKPVQNGRDTYKSLIVVRKNSGLKNFQDLKGKKFAFINRKSTSGYLFPRVKMADLGVVKLQDYFSKIDFVSDHQSALVSVCNGYVDASVVSDFVLDSEESGKYKKDLDVIMETEDIPLGCFVARNDLDPEYIAKLKAAFLDIDKSADTKKLRKIMKIDKYIEAKDSDYNVIRDAMKKLSTLKDGDNAEDLE